MEGSARRMAPMIDGLQAIARAGRPQLRLQSLDLAGAVQQACAALPRPTACNGTLPRHAAGAGPTPELRCPAGDTQLCQCPLSARRPSAHPGARQRGAAGRVHVTCAWDNGAALTPRARSSCFGVFQRLHREADFDSVGAAWPLCQAIAQRHGGTSARTAAPGGLVASAWIGPGLGARLFRASPPVPAGAGAGAGGPFVLRSGRQRRQPGVGVEARFQPARRARSIRWNSVDSPRPPDCSPAAKPASSRSTTQPGAIAAAARSQCQAVGLASSSSARGLSRKWCVTMVMLPDHCVAIGGLKWKAWARRPDCWRAGVAAAGRATCSSRYRSPGWRRDAAFPQAQLAPGLPAWRHR